MAVWVGLFFFRVVFVSFRDDEIEVRRRVVIHSLFTLCAIVDDRGDFQ